METSLLHFFTKVFSEFPSAPASLATALADLASADGFSSVDDMKDALDLHEDFSTSDRWQALAGLVVTAGVPTAASAVVIEAIKMALKAYHQKVCMIPRIPAIRSSDAPDAPPLHFCRTHRRAHRPHPRGRSRPRLPPRRQMLNWSTCWRLLARASGLRLPTLLVTGPMSGSSELSDSAHAARLTS